ncbi:hypothetical protein [Yinghuangia soli]|uniref:Uncharacterized protein n=1 Tax=Yinghuangia soli TaxID=2908204 RepID=A0AA41Q2Y1_9ACTN|nr:hypothetical protein [Yinghuangia soli]MCF2529449.1 hypothetical protein [Yinghuangia soli]
MTRNPLFSTYRTSENRVTSSLLAVLQRLESHIVERILGGAIGETTLSLLTYTNQPTQGKDAPSVPDASISASFRWLFEVKTTKSALTKPGQLGNHLSLLTGTHADERLFVLTPDPEQPKGVTELADPRVVWFNFAALSQSIDALLADPDELVGEQGVFLLRELQALFRLDDLLEHEDVAIVAAREAYPEYLRHGAYVCQPNRSFRSGITHFGFYTDKAIRQEIAAILYSEEAVHFTLEEATRRKADPKPEVIRIGELIEHLLAEDARAEGAEYKVLLLSTAKDDRTVLLPHLVTNTKLDASGRTTAWTQGQRYVRLSALGKGPRTTGELDTLH